MRSLSVPAACLVLLAFTVGRNRDWRDNESIFRATLEGNPRSIRAHFNLAVTYQDLLGNPAGARRHYERVLELRREQKAAIESAGTKPMFWEDEIESHFSLARLYAQQGRHDKAMSHYKVLLSLEPNEGNRPMMVEAALAMGQWYSALGDRDQAQRLFERAAKLEPHLQREIQRVSGQPGA